MHDLFKKVADEMNIESKGVETQITNKSYDSTDTRRNVIPISQNIIIETDEK